MITRKTIRKLQIAIILFCSVAVYLNTLGNGFVIDDIPQVVENRWIRDIRHIPEIFSGDVWSFEERESNYYRPLMHLVFLVNYHVFGLSARGFHLVNALFHGGVSVLVFLLISILLERVPSSPHDEQRTVFRMLSPPFLASLLFVAHPVHTEAVAWVSGLPDLSFTFFSLLSFYLYIRSGESAGYSIFSAVSFFLATLSKEPALTLPVILLAYDYTFRKEEMRITASLRRYLPFVIALGCYFALRLHAIGGFVPAGKQVTLTLYQYIINVLFLFARYLEKLVLPANLNVWHVFHHITSLVTAEGMISLLVTSAYAYLAYTAARKNRVAFIGMLIIIVPLLPTLYIPALTQGIEHAFTERYLYLPSVGFVLLSALLLDRLKGHRWAPALTLIFIFVVGLYSVGTITRNTVWKDSYSLWSDAVKKSPESASAHQNLGYALLYKGQTEEGKEQLRAAFSLDPYLPEEIIRTGIAYSNNGFIDKAIFKFNIVLIVNPDSIPARYNLGLAYDKKGWKEQAVEQYKITLLLDPGHADAHNNLGIIYAQQGAIDKAIEQFQAALKSDPDNPAVLQNLGRAYRIKGLPR